jgi:hypothetical protein
MLNPIEQRVVALVNYKPSGVKVHFLTFYSQTAKRLIAADLIGQEVRQGMNGPEFYLVPGRKVKPA